MQDTTTTKHKILLVEDDHDLATMVSVFLAQNGFEVAIEERGDTAVARILDEKPEAVVLDVNLPGLNGFEVCRQVRDDYHGAILILTARGDEIDEVTGIESGADDFMTKPVRPMALLARLRSHLERLHPEEPLGTPIQVGSLILDPTRRSAVLQGKSLDLTTAEFELLKLLADHAGKPISRNDIYQIVHGIKYDGLDRSIDLRISRLRKKLGDDPARPQRILSVRGTGYQLSVEQ